MSNQVQSLRRKRGNLNRVGKIPKQVKSLTDGKVRKVNPQRHLTVRLAERVYEIDGEEFARAIEATGMNQKEFAAECGYTDPSRINQLIHGRRDRDSGGRRRVGEEVLMTIVRVLDEYGVTISGLE